MTAHATTLTPLVWKEVRALAPTFAAALAAVLIGWVSDDYGSVAIGLLGFAFGTITLGAQSMGHEFHNRTMGLLLAQPLPRARIYLLKLVVLALMIAALTTITLPLYSERLLRAASRDTQPATLLMVATCGLFLAPFLTVLCRTTLAAVVFTVAIPGLLATGGDLVGVWIYGSQNASAVDRFKEDVFWRGMFAICGLAAIAGWWTFARLEVMEGHRDIALPGWLTLARRTSADSTTRTRHFIRALVGKELRLQQIPYVVAALYASAMVTLPRLDLLAPDTLQISREPVTVMYAGIVALLVGSLASAQERHLGTLEWQTLQPVPAWQQWAVKVGVAWLLAIALSVALPAVLDLLQISARPRRTSAAWMAVAVVVLATAALYISTLCRNSMSAFVLSIPVLAATAALSSVFQNSVGSVVYHAYSSAGHRPRFLSTRDMAEPWIVLVLTAGLLWFGFVNHRTADRSVRRITLQTLALAGSFVAGLTIVILRVVR